MTSCCNVKLPCGPCGLAGSRCWTTWRTSGEVAGRAGQLSLVMVSSLLLTRVDISDIRSFVQTKSFFSVSVASFKCLFQSYQAMPTFMVEKTCFNKWLNNEWGLQSSMERNPFPTNRLLWDKQHGDRSNTRSPELRNQPSDQITQWSQYT
jgi:hypothetical protein